MLGVQRQVRLDEIMEADGCLEVEVEIFPVVVMGNVQERAAAAAL